MESLFKAQEWRQAVSSLKEKASYFMSILERVDATGPVVINDPILRAQRARLIERSEIVRSTVDKTARGIDYVYSIYNNIFGNNTVNGLGSLGIIPLVPVIVISGAGAAITYWVTDALKFLKRVGEVEKLKASGVSTERAYAIVDREGGIIGFMRAALPVAVIGGIIWFISRKKRV